MNQKTPPIIGIMQRIAQLSDELSVEAPDQAAGLNKATGLIADDLAADVNSAGSASEAANSLDTDDTSTIGPSAVEPLSSQDLLNANLDDDDFAGLDPDVAAVFIHAQKTGDLESALATFIDRIAAQVGVSPEEAQHPSKEQIDMILDAARQKIEGVQ